MVLSITGVGSGLTLKFLDRTWDRQLETLRTEPQHSRAAESFQERIAGISTPEELVKDFEVYSFVMRAFNLEDQIFGKGLIRKMLESDPSDNTSLVNRLTDPRFKDLHTALGFTTAAGPQIPDFSAPGWQDGIVNRYYDRVLINGQSEKNENVATVLEFREKVEGLNSWFDVLKDKELTGFFQVALGLPSEVSGLDIDKQAEIFGRKYDLSKLSDPDEQQRLIGRFLAVSDVLNPPQAEFNSAALSVLQTVATGGSGWQFVPITLDIPPISFSSLALYR